MNKVYTTTTLYAGRDFRAALEAVRKDAKGRAAVWLFRRRAAGVQHSSATAILMKTVAEAAQSAMGVSLERMVGSINRLFMDAANSGVPEMDPIRYDWLYDEYERTLTITVTEVVNAPQEAKTAEEART